MKILFTIALAITAFVTQAQVYKIQRAWAFVTESAPGRIMKDDDGKEIKPAAIVERFIYIETNYKAVPVIAAVLYNGKSFAANPVAVNEAKHQAGIGYSNGKPFYITPKKGNKLWKLVLEGTGIPANTAKLITIKGKLGSSSFKQTLYTEIRLSGPEYQ